MLGGLSLSFIHQKSLLYIQCEVWYRYINPLSFNESIPKDFIKFFTIQISSIFDFKHETSSKSILMIQMCLLLCELMILILKT